MTEIPIGLERFLLQISALLMIVDWRLSITHGTLKTENVYNSYCTTEPVGNWACCFWGFRC